MVSLPGDVQWLLPRRLVGNDKPRRRTTNAIFWVLAHEECIPAEGVVSLGRRSARVRTAHVLSELLARLYLVVDSFNYEVDLPLIQQDLADAFALSVVHANKTLRAFESEGVISLKQSRLDVLDRGALNRMAGFENRYLQFTRRR